MKTTVAVLALGLLLVDRAMAALSPEGVECGEKRCSTVEYCSPYDKHCKPCSSICDAAGRNYQPLECASDCQEYLHDKRYVLQKRYEVLRGEVGRLWVLVSISISVSLVSLLLAVYLLADKFARWEKMRGAVRRAFAGKWTKRAANGRTGTSTAATNNNDTDNNKNHRRKAQDDAESGTSKPNGLKLTMPTISASVAPSRYSEHAESGSGSGTGTGIGNATPNTTSTSLSRRHPSEDTTLDYAYDNPAMTPSPETAQPRTKRESSF